MRMGFGYTGALSLHGVLIRLITGGGGLRLAPYNHVLIWFEGEEGDCGPLAAGDREYFEAFWKVTNFVEKEDGVRGPVPWAVLAEWVLAAQSHQLTAIALPYEDSLCRRAWEFCVLATKTIRYAKLQLLYNAEMCLFGKGISSGKPGDTAWTCSEFAARLWRWLDPGAPCFPGPSDRLLRLGDILFNAITPSGRQYGLYEAHHEFMQTYYHKETAQ